MVSYRDIDGHISRNRERIEDGIMPQVFKKRLEHYEKQKAYIDNMIASEPAGLSMAVITRLETLKNMKKIYERDGDRNGQLPNVEALIKAYREGELTWSENGEVTYWSKGKQLSQPREFDFDELTKFNCKYDTGTGFWVEGVSSF